MESVIGGFQGRTRAVLQQPIRTQASPSHTSSLFQNTTGQKHPENNGQMAALQLLNLEAAAYI